MSTSENSERAGRILAAAAALIARYGYDKTSVDEIAREAGVSKGAIYLHFAGKDELFGALLRREIAAFGADWLERMEADPEGGTIAGLYKNMLHVLGRRPLMAAMFRHDRRLLGSALRRPDGPLRDFQQRGGPSPRYEFVQAMQAAGAVRADIDPKVIAHVMNMLAFGLVSMDGVVPPEETPPLDDLIAGIAALMDRALAPPGGGDREAGKAIVRRIVAAAQQA